MRAHCADALDEKIKALGPENVLAFVMEPVGGRGDRLQRRARDYYRRVREICTRHGIALVFDEILCGTGRTGKFLAAHNWPDALPDVVVMAKGLGSGYAPLGATLFPAKWADRLAETVGFGFSHTYCANPISCATGVAVLEEYERQNIIANTVEQGAYLRKGLEALKAKTSVIGDIRGLGLCMAVELVTDKATKAAFPLDYRGGRLHAHRRPETRPHHLRAPYGQGPQRRVDHRLAAHEHHPQGMRRVPDGAARDLRRIRKGCPLARTDCLQEDRTRPCQKTHASSLSTPR